MTVDDLTRIDEQSVNESVIEVLDALLEAMPTLAGEPRPPTGTTLQGTIDVLCDAPARIHLRTAEATGLKLAEAWHLVGQDGPQAEDAIDAVSELTNLVGGSIKILFEQESSLGIPSVTSFEGAPEPDDHPWIDVFHDSGHFQLQLRVITD